ncbi:MAG: DNA polymerase III subunit delta [Polyangiaceae bacterium]|nr:DNA polymerase III subunit delta [Polyangiaceae bacterium]
MNPDEAVAELRAGKARPVYLLVGAELVLVREVLAAARAAALEGGVPGLNEDHLVAGEARVETVLDAVRTLPMLARRRLVVVRSLERWEPDARGSRGAAAAKPTRAKAGKGRQDGARAEPLGELDRLAEYLAAPSPSTLLVLAAERLDGRRRLFTAARAAGALVECSAPHRNALPGWVARAAKQHGNPMSTRVAELIVGLAGTQLGPLADAVERITLYAGPGAEVTEEHVAACLERTPAATVWELVGALSRRDLGRTLAAHAAVDASESGPKLVGMLARTTRQLLAAESALRRRADAEGAAVAAGAPPFKAREVVDQARRIPRADLERWLETLARLDFALKGGSRRTDTACVEQTLIELCSGAGVARPA